MLRSRFAPPYLGGALTLLLAGTGCLFPEYTFDEGGGGRGGTASQGAGGLGAGGSGGDGGQGGTPPVEDCFVSGDEDGDGDADCADSDCNADLECVDAIPVGWGAFGYVALFRGPVADEPGCPGAATTAIYGGSSGLTNTAATCSACDCGSPTWSSCELTDHDVGSSGLQGLYTRNVDCLTTTATGSTELTVPTSWDGACSALNTAAGGQTCAGLPCNTSVQSMGAKPVNGTCEPMGGTPDGGTPSFDTAVKGCKVDAGLQGCDSGKTCAPRPPAPFEGRVCLAKAGDQSCPTGYGDKSIAYSGFDDTRACTDCSCDPATGGTCKITTSLFSAANCGGTAIQSVESGKCANLTGNPAVAGRSSQITTPPSGGGCAVAGGGDPTGAVTPLDPITFCCLPN